VIVPREVLMAVPLKKVLARKSPERPARIEAEAKRMIDEELTLHEYVEILGGELEIRAMFLAGHNLDALRRLSRHDHRTSTNADRRSQASLASRMPFLP